MAVTSKRVGLIRRAWVSPECEDGRGLAASLLGAGDRSPVRYVVHELPPCEALRAHMHSEDLAVCVVRGRVTFWIGESFEERIDVGPGDYILLPRMLAHRETAGPQGVEMVVAHLAPFETVTME